ncbi:MAG: site-2 protease family protein [Chloroflexi bacterium]|nr:MAG: site-2 protease family protein [Chloroflexota bacterium]
MMGVVGTILAFVVVLVILVLVHELGHFIAAKLAGITVEEFGIGFPPRLASVIWRGTRYSLNAIPLGGFVKMLGENGESDAERMRSRGLSAAAVEHAMAGAFNRKPIWVRVLVLVAGVAMNFVLAVVLYAVAFTQPVPDHVGPLTVTSVQPGSPAAIGKSPLLVGDRIVGVDDKRFGIGKGDFHLARQLTDYVNARAGQGVVLWIVRNGHQLGVSVTPRSLTEAQREQGIGPVGFGWESPIVDGPPTASGPFQAADLALQTATDNAVQIPGALAKTVAGLLGLAPNTGEARGPIGIAQVTGEVLQEPLVTQLLFMGLLSVNLAILNVLPFPPLDGGRVAVVLLEAVRRRRLPAEREALIYLTGFLVLITLVILISIQDIARLPGS